MPQPWTRAQIDIVYAVAEPIEPAQRERFFAVVASELALYPVLGEGLIYRVAAETQSRFDVPARISASDGSVARRFSKRRRTIEVEA